MSDNYKNDQLRIIIKPEDIKDSLHFFKQVLAIFADSFIPKPDQIIQADGVKYAIDGFLDPLVISTLEKEISGGKNTFELIHQSQENVHAISTSGNIYSLTAFKLLPPNLTEALRQFVIRLIDQTQPAFISCTMDQISRQIYFKYFEWEDRTRLSANLEWLQYFGPEEFQRQGGQAIFNNKFIQAESRKKGVLIQVGKSPLDAYTESGQQLLVEATKAMPPVIQD